MDHFFLWQLRRISAPAARLAVEEALLWWVAVESEGHIGEAMQIDRCSRTVFSLQRASTRFGEAVDGQSLLPREVRGRRIKHASAVRGVVVGERVADARLRAPLRAVGVLQAVARLQKPVGRPAPALPNEGVRLGPEVRASSVPMRKRSEVVDALHREAVGVVEGVAAAIPCTDGVENVRAVKHPVHVMELDAVSGVCVSERPQAWGKSG